MSRGYQSFTRCFTHLWQEMRWFRFILSIYVERTFIIYPSANLQNIKNYSGWVESFVIWLGSIIEYSEPSLLRKQKNLTFILSRWLRKLLGKPLKKAVLLVCPGVKVFSVVCGWQAMKVYLACLLDGRGIKVNSVIVLQGCTDLGLCDVHVRSLQIFWVFLTAGDGQVTLQWLCFLYTLHGVLSALSERCI